MTNWTTIQQWFWKSLISRMWLGEIEGPSQGRLEEAANLRGFAEWLTEFVLTDPDKHHSILREIEDLALDTLHYLHDPDERVVTSARALVARLLEPIFTRGLLNEFDPVFRRLIGYVIGLDVGLALSFGVTGPAGEFFDSVPQEEMELRACEILKQFFAGQRPEKLRYLLPFHIGILLERTIDVSIARTSEGQPLHISIPEDVPLLFLPLAADPPLRKRLLEHFRTCFEEVEPPLGHLISELLPDLTANDLAIFQKSLRNFYCAYLLSAHFQLSRDPVRGFAYLANLPLAELDALCGVLPLWSKGTSFQELIEAQLQENKATSEESSQSQKASTLPILLGPSELALLFARFSEDLLQQYPESRRPDVLSHWAEMVETGIDLFDSLRWLGVLLSVVYRFPDLKVVVGGKERLLREWLTEHLLKVLRYKPQKPALSIATEKNPLPDIEFFRRSIHAKILRLAFRVVASPVHMQALNEAGDNKQEEDVAGKLLMRGVILAHRILLVLLHHSRLPLDQIDKRLTEATSSDVSPWSSLYLRDQFNPELYGPEPGQYDHLLSGTLAVFREVGLGEVTGKGGARVSSSVPFWLTRPVRHALMALSNHPENDAERQIREARGQGVPNRLQTFLNCTPQEYAAELLRFASSKYTNEEDVLLRGQTRLLNLLRQASDAVSVEIESPSRRPDQPDVVARVKIKGEEKFVLVEAKASAEPRYLRQAIVQLQSSMERFSASYGIIVAPSISERGGKLCEENGIGYIDLRGNAFIRFDGVFISTAASRKDIRQRGRPKSMFSPVSTRFVRALLAEPGRRWKLRELAEAAHMSLGQAHKVKQELLNQEFIEASQKKQISLKDPTGLLNAWQETYRYESNEVLSLFSLDKIPTIEEKVKQYCDTRKIRYALTLFSGAAKLAPFVRYSIAAFYFIGDREELKQELNLKPVDSGANVLLLSPYDEGVFHGVQEAQGYMVVNTVQLYLDLYSYGSRGREQAEFLREKLIGF